MIKCIKYATTGSYDKAWRKGNWLLLNSNYPGGPTSNSGFYNHIEPPEGGYTLYMYKASGGPSIYVFNNNTELFDFCNNNLGAAQSDIFGTLDWIGTQDNYFVDPTYFHISIYTVDSGISDYNQFQLPLVSNGSIDFVIDWGDETQDTITTYDQSETLHTYSSEGQYSLKIAGKLRGWKFNDAGDEQKLLEIYKWGCFNFTDSGAFYGCDRIFEPYCVDVPRISTLQFAFAYTNYILDTSDYGGFNVDNVTSLRSAFINNYYFTGVNLKYWNTSNVTNMQQAFSYTDLSEDIGNWDVSSVTNMLAMFNGTSNFNQDISNWDVSSVVNMGVMFQDTNFNQPIGKWDVSSVTNMSSMFRFNFSFDQDISDWNISNVTNFLNFMQGNSVFSHLDAVYTKWSQLSVTPNLNINFGTATYTSAGAAGRNILTNTYGWTITDGGQV